MNHSRRWTSALLCTSALALVAGCGKPSAANIELRKQNQAFRDELTSLKLEKEGLAQSLSAATGAPPSTTRPALSVEHLASLFTTHDLSLGRLTGAADLDPNRPGDEGLKIYVVPTDEQADTLKSAGSFVVEAFDLSAKQQTRVGEWTFDPQQSRAAWHGQGLLFTYVLTCPWQTAPTSAGEWTVKVRFTDTLTGRTLTKQAQVKVQPAAPASTRPTGS